MLRAFVSRDQQKNREFQIYGSTFRFYLDRQGWHVVGLNPSFAAFGALLSLPMGLIYLSQHLVREIWNYFFVLESDK